MVENSGSLSDSLDLAAAARWKPAQRVWSVPLVAENAQWLWFAAFLVFSLSVQWALGAHLTDLGNHSDEPAHFMNGLVLRDYLTTGTASDPLSFAGDYYTHYPKIAPLVWPPLFHVALGLFLLPGWPPHSAALVFVALIAAATAWRLSTFVALFESPLVARLLPFVFLSVPLIVESQLAVMVDLAVAMTALEAAWWLYRYLVEPRRRHAVLFGVWSAACCLTKGNGAAVLLLVPATVLIARRWALLKDPGCRLAAALVVVLAAPFLYLSYRVCAAMGDFTASGLVDFEHRLAFFAQALWHQVTPAPLVLAVGAGAVLIAGKRRAQAAPSTIGATILFALAFAGLAFHVGLPLSSVAPRYMAMTVAPLIGLMPIGAAALTWWAPQQRRRTLQQVALAIAVASVVAFAPLPQPKQSLGFKQTVEALPSVAGTRFFISSDATGEGAFISEVAQRAPNPRATVIRASKLLVTEDWMGAGSRPLFTTASRTLQQLRDLRVDYVVVDESPAAMQTPYSSHMRDVVAAGGGVLERVAHIDPATGVRRSIALYRLTPAS